VSGTVIVVGEALVDLVLPPSGPLEAHLGGGPFNAARTVGRLGVPVAFLACVSEDRFGRDIAAALEADGVSTDCLVRSPAPTMLALAELDERGSASYQFYVEGTATPDLTTGAALDVLPEDVSVLCVGTLGLVLEPMASTSEALIEAVAGRAPVLVDPNVRPVLIPDREAYRTRLRRVLAQADVVKVSDEDLRWLEPGRDPADIAAEWLALGTRLVVVTRGGDGISGYLRESAIHVPTSPVEVVDTIGAGDSVAGALLVWLHEQGRDGIDDEHDVRTALELACRVGAITVSRAGANPPFRDELEAGTTVI
jgi:fructokinase